MFEKFLLEDEFNEQEGKYEICLGSGTLKAHTLDELLAFYDDLEREEILSTLTALALDYSEQFGADGLRQILLKTYLTAASTGLEQNLSALTAESFITSSGASEGIFLVFSSLLKAGDTIIVQKPIYQSLYQLALDRGINVINWDYDAAASFADNFADLEKLIQGLSKRAVAFQALVLNNPNNPSGVVFTELELMQITTLLNKSASVTRVEELSPDSETTRRPLLIVDEVFRDLVSNLASAINFYDRAVVISDLSKSYAFPGLRLGWVLTRDAELLSLLSSNKNYLSLRTNTISEYLASYILRKRSEILAQHRDIIRQNIDYLLSIPETELPFILKNRSALKNYQVGLCIFPKIKDDCLELLTDSRIREIRDKTGVFIVSGNLFGAQYAEHMRLGLGLEPVKFKSALQKLMLFSKSIVFS